MCRNAEIDGNDRNAGGLGRVDIGLRIADHERLGGIAAGAPDGFQQVARIGLAEGECILAAIGGEVLA